jgi:GTP-binding protein
MAGYADARFLISAARPEQFLPDAGAEVAFAGRSNSGKSTAINRILGRRQLARTSKTPGRTQLVNFFGLGPRHRVVDLPGYGFARVAPVVQAEWRALIEAYFSGRRSLVGVFLVADARRGLTDFDRQMLAWMAALERPVHLLLSKCDQLSRAEADRLTPAVAAEVGTGNTWQFFSGRTGDGLPAARERLQALLRG